MRLPLLLSAALLAVAPAIALADSAESPSRMANAPRIGNMDTAQFLAYHDGIQRDIAAGRYGELDSRTRETIAAQQRLIRGRLHDGIELDALSESSRLDVFNAHDRVVALLNGDDDQRMVCRKEHQVGSHRSRVVCLTERDRELAAQQNQLRNIHKDSSID
ncbi:MAG TPA: hypothetical protein VFL14_05625 [Xanthomonadales bacterium]|nr:hypothetical protein [Xanthomonadales bacterium]